MVERRHQYGQYVQDFYYPRVGDGRQKKLRRNLNIKEPRVIKYNSTAVDASEGEDITQIAYKHYRSDKPVRKKDYTNDNSSISNNVQGSYQVRNSIKKISNHASANSQQQSKRGHYELITQLSDGGGGNLDQKSGAHVAKSVQYVSKYKQPTITNVRNINNKNVVFIDQN